MTSCLICLKQKGWGGGGVSLCAWNIYCIKSGCFDCSADCCSQLGFDAPRGQDCASARALLPLLLFKIPNGSQYLQSTNPSGFTSVLFLNQSYLLSALLPSLLHPTSFSAFSLHPQCQIHPLLSFASVLLSRMGALEPGRSADMSNVAETDSYAKTSAVSVEPAMTQAREHTLTHTLQYIVNRHAGRQTWRCRQYETQSCKWPLSSPYIM